MEGGLLEARELEEESRRLSVYLQQVNEGFETMIQAAKASHLTLTRWEEAFSVVSSTKEC